MRRDHSQLQFLTMNQALENLRITTKLSMDAEDLLMHCANGNCTAYLRLEGVRGQTQVSGEPGDLPEVVYDAGPQEVRSVHAVRRARPGVPVTITMVGPVFEDDDSFEEVTKVWDAAVDMGLAEIIFKPADVTALSDKVLGVSPKSYNLDTREKASAGAIIAALASMPAFDIRQPWGVAEAIITAGELLGIEMPQDATIAKFMKLAVKAMDG